MRPRQKRGGVKRSFHPRRLLQARHRRARRLDRSARRSCANIDLYWMHLWDKLSGFRGWTPLVALVLLETDLLVQKLVLRLYWRDPSSLGLDRFSFRID